MREVAQVTLQRRPIRYVCHFKQIVCSSVTYNFKLQYGYPLDDSRFTRSAADWLPLTRLSSGRLRCATMLGAMFDPR